MSREILFRGKRVDNGEWVEGYFVKYQPSASKDEWVIGIVPNYASALYLIEVIPSTVGRYTEVTDKFDEKVFEGDYVYDEADEEIGIVKFDEGEFVVCFGDVIDGNRFADVVAYCHVIGNVHDTPNLLGGDPNA